MKMPTTATPKAPIDFWFIVELFRYALMAAFSVVGMATIAEKLLPVHLTGSIFILFASIFSGAVFTKLFPLGKDM